MVYPGEANTWKNERAYSDCSLKFLNYFSFLRQLHIYAFFKISKMPEEAFCEQKHGPGCKQRVS